METYGCLPLFRNVVDRHHSTPGTPFNSAGVKVSTSEAIFFIHRKNEPILMINFPIIEHSFKQISFVSDFSGTCCGLLLQIK